MDLFSIGEMVIDFLPGTKPDIYIRNAGGAPANTAIAVSRNGLSAGFCGKLGDDDFGHFLIETLQENNVKVLCKNLTDKAITTMAFVTLKENGERSFVFVRKPGADIFLEKNDIPLEDLDCSTVIHAGSSSLSKEPAATTTIFAIKRGHEKQKLISFDINYRDLIWEYDRKKAKERIYDIFSYVDLLKTSEEEIDMIGGESNVFNLMSNYNISLVMETLGTKGAKCFWNSDILISPPWGGDAVDTTGAGDAFWGGFLSKLLLDGITGVNQLNKTSITDAMKYGNIAGGLCVQKKGAITSLPVRKEIERYFDRIKQNF
jgi:sugar/nucleoside kinase (ribokinase family)